MYFSSNRHKSPHSVKQLCGLLAIYFSVESSITKTRSAVLLGLIEHAVGFSEQVLDLLRENKAVRADAAADRDLLENTGNIAQELRQQMLQLVRRQIYIEHYGKLVTADTADRAAETKGVLQMLGELLEGTHHRQNGRICR